MTTVVWCDGVLATDGRLVEGDRIVADDSVKFHAIPGGVAVPVGTIGDTMKLVDWFCEGREGDRPSVGDASLIVFDWDNSEIVQFTGDSYVGFSIEGDYAWGSGASAALGAIQMGADARDAVGAACAVDVYSGGVIFSLEQGQEAGPLVIN